MPKSIINPSKKPVGRPPVDSEQVNIRLQRPILDALDQFIAEEPDAPSRPEAVRRLAAKQLTELGYFKAND